MVVKVLKSRSSSQSVIDYNEKKVEEGNACVLACRNLASDDTLTIEDTFQQYEKNPAISERTRGRSFHMTVGPGPGENLSKEKVIELVDRLMKSIGYENQPYVIYQHNDIEREHYHVLSTKFDERGKKIDDAFVGKVLSAELSSLEEEFGFKKGRGDEEVETVESDRSRVPHFVMTDANVTRSLEALFRRALQYPVGSFYHLQAIMRAMGVRVTARKNRSGGMNILLRGLDRNGEPVTPFFSMKRVMKVDGWKLLENALSRVEMRMGPDEIERKKALGIKSAYCMARSRSADEYVGMLRQLNVFAGLVRDRNGYERVTLVDVENDTLLDSGWKDELRLTDFINAERDGGWDANNTGCRELSEDELTEVRQLLSEDSAEEVEEDTDISIE